ncbi:flagellar hook capping FlgD N-terminal domain-containing protein [Paenibacillus sp. NEAU-GSW1]|uniref:flagellar hook capping FlgD N-terminal domain-containing protein n=1 Tax=Paenibacillus sp. NEAU-GSW1 TaxID=2682486 RepID=UPI0012E2B13F|nr:flagellar hook capping FlgD N-terminal domain-containing protein [Paenibacillus sp. NEAU-GSW1]MUT66357.1 flagellar hook assembly protein FlgD [Paenibacillus sp. NEAU-GSW1]
MATVSSKVTWPNYSEVNVQTAAAKENDSMMGKDDFLKILVTQLQNQDPLQPMQDKEFIAQMAQFTSVEQLTNMSEQIGLLRQNLGSASTMIGKTVQWYELNDAGQSAVVSDVVESVVVSGGKQYVKFGDDTMVLVDDLISISETSSTDTDADTDASAEDKDSSNSESEGAETA